MHIPEIRALLESSNFPVIDRAMVESLFGLRRRRAIELLHCFGGFQTGQSFLIERLKLIEELKSIEGGIDFSAESRRRQRLSEHLEQVRRWHKAKSVVIEVDRDALPARVKRLGDGVLLQPGNLHIEFSGTEDLLTKLFHLSQAAANDYEAFQAASEGAGQENRRPLLD